MLFFGKANKKSKENLSESSVLRDSCLNCEAKVILSKSEACLDKHVITLKEKGLNLETHRAKVVVVMDRSASMKEQYESGKVQKILTRLYPLALRFDDDKELEVIIFNTVANELIPMNMVNFENYVWNYIIRKNQFKPAGGTNYAPAINKILKNYKNSKIPVFVIYITDGENWDQKQTDEAVRETAKKNIFIQFVGMKTTNKAESFTYLRKLDNLDRRICDNTSFVDVADFERTADQELFNLILGQYPSWLKKKGFIS